METLEVLDKSNVKSHLNCYLYMLNNKSVILRNTSGIPISGIQTVMKISALSMALLNDM